MFSLISVVLLIGYAINAWGDVYVYEVLIAASIFGIAGSIEIFAQKFKETVQASDAFKALINNDGMDVSALITKIKQVTNRDGQD